MTPTDLGPEPVPAEAPGSVADTADRVAAAVLAVDGVVALHGGRLATYLPGRRVAGVRLVPGGAEVGVVVEFGTPLAALAQRVRRAVAPLAGPQVGVVVGDVVDVGEEWDPGDRRG